MRIGIPREIHPGEKRVAVTPDGAEKMRTLGFFLAVEAGAGLGAHFSDEDYRRAGCEVVTDPRVLWNGADLILKVRAPEEHPALGVHETTLLKPGQTLVSFVWPGQHPECMKRMAATGASVLAMDCVPRISRAQKLDALSSTANIAGYRAVIEAAHSFGRFFTGQVTAAGKMPPAKVLVIGAGVAGLAAIGAAGSLGAVVRGFDTRPEVKDQIKSMGAEFLELDFKEDGTGQGGYAKVMSAAFIQAEMELFAQQAKEVDIIITTALIPGKAAPKLITAEMVKSMRAGSVIVDLAAEQGGNCELTEPGTLVVKHGVNLIGYTDLPSRLSKQASLFYSNNLLHLLEELCPAKDGVIRINMDDDVLRGTTVIKDGVIVWPPPPLKKPAMAPVRQTAPAVPTAATEKAANGKRGGAIVAVAALAMALALVGVYAPPTLMRQLTVFVLACFVGYMVIWNVKAALHTPLMSVTNAISGIIAVGAILQLDSASRLVQALAAFALLVTMVNVSGGFLVTQRMLKMFRK